MNNNKIWSGWKLAALPEKGSHGPKRRRWERAVERRTKQMNLILLLDQLVPGSAAGQPGLVFTPDIQERISSWINTQSSENRATSFLRRLYRQGIVAGIEQLSWQAQVPPAEISLRTELNPVTPYSFMLLSRYRKLVTAFQENLICIRITDTELRYGQLLFSAVALGGLCDRRALLQLAYARDKLVRHNDYAWVDFFTECYPGGVAARRGLRRWFPDPVSLILLTRLPALPPGVGTQTGLSGWISTCLRKYVRLLADYWEGGVTPLTVKELLAAASVANHLIMPPFLAHYAAGHVAASAWPEKTWIRALVQKKSLIHSSLPQEIIPLPSKAATKARAAGSTAMKQVFMVVRTALHKRPSEKEPSFFTISQALRSALHSAEQSSPVLYALLSWIHHRYSAKQIRRSTAYQQLTSIGSDLLAEINDSELYSMEAEDFIGCYELILEKTPSAITRKNKADLLRRFHAHAVAVLGLPSIRLSYADDGFFSEPDANLFLESEYQRLFNYLQKHKAQSPEAHAQLIMLILGFRCGLRISEVRHIRMEELQYRSIGMVEQPGSDNYKNFGSMACTLLIRGDSYNRLKSISSRRNLPLNLLVDDAERIELILYHQQQLKKLSSSSSLKGRYLFSDHAESLVPMDLSVWQAQLHELMRQITGDNSLRFHHLRHSFATHALQTVSRADQPLTLTDHWKGNLRTEATRKNLFQITSFLGHSSPAVTLQNYTHNLDLLLRDALWSHSFCHIITGRKGRKQMISGFNVAACVSALLNMSDGSFRHHNSTSGNHIMGWLPKRLKVRAAYCKKEWTAYPRQLTSTPPKFRDLTDLSFANWCEFLLRWARDEHESELIEAFYLEPNIAKTQMQALMKVFQQEVSYRGNSRIARQPWKGDKKDPDWTPAWNIPLPPTYNNQEIEIARSFYERSLQMLRSETNGDCARSGLKFFFENYREWGRYIAIRPQQASGSEIDCFEQLLAQAAKGLPVRVDKKIRSEDAVHKLAGAFKIISLPKGKKEKTDYGAPFGLLMAFLSGCYLASV